MRGFLDFFETVDSWIGGLSCPSRFQKIVIYNQLRQNKSGQ